MSGNRALLRAGFVLASVLPIALIVAKIAIDGVNFPFVDQFSPHSSVDVALASAEHRLKFTDLLAQNFEHRIFFTHLTTALLARFGHWDLRIEMFLSVALAAASLVLLLTLLRRQLPETWFYAALPISLLLFSLRQQLNWLWGFETQWYFAIFFISAEAFLLCRPERRFAVPLASLFAGCAMFSFGAGILAIPLGLCVLVIAHRWRDVLIWVVSSSVTIALFLTSYRRGFSPSPQPSRIPVYARFVVTCLGGDFVVSGEEQIRVAALVGFLKLAIFGIALWWSVHRRERFLTLAPWLVLAGYGLGTGVLVSLSSRGAPLSNAIAGRYATNSTLFTIAAIALTAMAIAPRGEPGDRLAAPKATLALLAAGWLVLFAMFGVASKNSFATPGYLANRGEVECSKRFVETGELCFDALIPWKIRVASLVRKLAKDLLAAFAGFTSGKRYLGPIYPARTVLSLDPSRPEDWQLSPAMVRLPGTSSTFRVGQGSSFVYRKHLDIPIDGIEYVRIRMTASPDLGEPHLLAFLRIEGEEDFSGAHAAWGMTDPDEPDLYWIPMELIAGLEGKHLRGLRVDPRREYLAARTSRSDPAQNRFRHQAA